ncbi:undecaprenyl-diphosphate phosphatase [Bacteroidota bacterium]
MNWFEALILGLIQGLTEFLPVSSSGHLELGKALFGINPVNSLSFTVVVHGATVLSTVLVFFNEILKLIKGFFRFKWNTETQYIIKILIAIIPVGIVGIFFNDFIDGFFDGNIVFVGSMLCLTAFLLMLATLIKTKRKAKEIGFFDAFLIGIAQAFATLPGISRSGSTIATGILIGNKKSEIARFSFLIVLLPVIAGNTLNLLSGDMISGESTGSVVLLIGFVSAFISGYIACKWMINIVKRGKLKYFAIYCLLIGIIAIMSGIL